MLLSLEDIRRLEKKGYDRSFFVRFDKEGYALLRNRQGYCVFYNTSERLCNAYAYRPSGCRVYPVILDEDKGIIVDDICHSQATISDVEKDRKGKLVIKLLEKIDSEAITRSRSSS